MMRRIWWIGCLMACSNPAMAPSPTVDLKPVAGDAQPGAAGYPLAQPLSVILADGDGVPIAGATVRWSTAARGGVLSPATSLTNGDGIASSVWHLGRDDGDQFAGASYQSAPAVEFRATAVSGDVTHAGGISRRQCGVFSDGTVRCWASPDNGPARAIAIDTDLRFTSLGFAVDRWCGTTTGGAVACIVDAELMPGGVFRPEAAPVHVVAEGVPTMLRIAGAGSHERATTWCAQATDQSVWCWGNNDSGQLGRGTVGGTSQQPAPVLLSDRVVSFSVTPGAACAVDVRGAAWCWGDNGGGVVDAAQPSGIPVPVPTALRFSQIAGDGSGAVCAVGPELQIYCWGSNATGGRGRNGLEASSQPMPIEGTMFYIAVSGGSDGFLALTNDRTLVAWGGLPPERGATPVELIRDHVFAAILPGGGSWRCVQAYPLGTRCLDRVGLAQTTIPTADLLHGVPATE